MSQNAENWYTLSQEQNLSKHLQMPVTLPLKTVIFKNRKKDKKK